jgi:hypothetical protein
MAINSLNFRAISVMQMEGRKCFIALEVNYVWNGKQKSTSIGILKSSITLAHWPKINYEILY